MKSTYDLVILNRNSEYHVFQASWYDAVNKKFMGHKLVYGSTFGLKIPTLFLATAAETKRPYSFTNRRGL